MKLLGDARRFRDDLGTLLKVCDSPFSPLSTAMIVYTWVTSTQNFFEARILHSSAPQCAIVISLVSVLLSLKLAGVYFCRAKNQRFEIFTETKFTRLHKILTRSFRFVLLRSTFAKQKVKLNHYGRFLRIVKFCGSYKGCAKGVKYTSSE